LTIRAQRCPRRVLMRSWAVWCFGTASTMPVNSIGGPCALRPAWRGEQRRVAVSAAVSAAARVSRSAKLAEPRSRRFLRAARRRPQAVGGTEVMCVPSLRAGLDEASRRARVADTDRSSERDHVRLRRLPGVAAVDERGERGGLADPVGAGRRARRPSPSSTICASSAASAELARPRGADPPDEARPPIAWPFQGDRTTFSRPVMPARPLELEAPISTLNLGAPEPGQHARPSS